jgi:hypothetical protein
MFDKLEIRPLRVEVEGFKTNIQLQYCVSYSKKYEFSILRRRNKVFIRSKKKNISITSLNSL